MRFLPLLVAACLFILLAVALTGKTEHPPEPSLMVGKPLPALSIPSLQDGENRKLTGFLKDNPILINVMASWCAPCQRELPELQALKDKTGITMIAIAWKNKAEEVKKMLDKGVNPYDAVLLDLLGVTTVPLALTGVPETFIVAPDGTILFHSKSVITEQMMEEEILPLLEKQP